MSYDDVIVISKSPEFQQFLIEANVIQEGYYERIEKARPDDVRGKVLIGLNVPLYLASQAKMVIEIPMYIPPGNRQDKFTVDFFKQYAGKPNYYYCHQMRSSGL